MKRILSLLSIIANVSIVVSIIRDTYDKLGVRRKANFENEEIWIRFQ